MGPLVHLPDGLRKEKEIAGDSRAPGHTEETTQSAMPVETIGGGLVATVNGPVGPKVQTTRHPVTEATIQIRVEINTKNPKIGTGIVITLPHHRLTAVMTHMLQIQDQNA